MSEPSGSRGPTRGSRGRDSRGSNPAAAGMLLVASILLLGAVGLGIGALVGLPVPFALAGLFAGLAVGFAVVYSRYKDI